MNGITLPCVMSVLRRKKMWCSTVMLLLHKPEQKLSSIASRPTVSISWPLRPLGVEGQAVRTYIRPTGASRGREVISTVSTAVGQSDDGTVCGHWSIPTRILVRRANSHFKLLIQVSTSLQCERQMKASFLQEVHFVLSHSISRSYLFHSRMSTQL